jgi:hypothetical protein
MKSLEAKIIQGEYEKDVCRVCLGKTNQIFNIKGKMVFICRSCEKKIVKQSILFDYE